MNIYNTTTNEIVELTYAPAGCDCPRDLSADDDNIVYNAYEGRYEADAETIEWWAAWIAAKEEADSLVAAAREEIDSETVDEAINDMCHVEFGDQPAATKKAIIDLAAEQGFEVKTYSDGSIGLAAR